MVQSPKIFPNLHYEDLKTAVEWLCLVFGFEVHFLVEDADRGVLHAQLRMGNDLIMLGPVAEQAQNELRTPLSLPGQSQSIFVALEDVDGHFETAKRGEAVILAQPHTTESGTRLYCCLDLEGHMWTFGNYWGEPFTVETPE